MNADNLIEERLRTLYSVIRGLPNSVFIQNFWRDSPNSYKTPDDATLLAETTSNPHGGTVANGLGWACAYPEFKKQGLRFTDDVFGRPAYMDKTGLDAGMLFFGLTNEQAESLFPWDSNSSKFSDQRIFLKRLRKIMVEMKIITKGRSIQLALEERRAVK